MKPIRTLLVDDEPPARERLRWLLSRAPDVTIVGEAGDGEEAIACIAAQRPDLLFLDVQMPPPDGLAVLRATRDTWLPCTIFTTAYSEHAVTAFELHALDYLLKPFSPERFATALQRARAHLATATANPACDERVAALVADVPATAPVECFLVKNGETYTVVRADEIAWAESAGNYMVLHTARGRVLLRRTVQSLEAELDARHFFRSSRSSIVNLRHVREIEHVSSDDFVLRLADGARVPLTRGLRELRERLGAG